MNTLTIKKEFLKQLHSPQQLELLFEYLPDVYFFAKNSRGEFMMANDLFVRKCGVTSESDIIGRTDYDFFPSDRAESYVKDDEQVMSSGASIVNKVELAAEPDNSINWFVTSKVALYSNENKIVGVAGTSRDIQKANSTLKPYAEMSGVIEHINRNYNTQIEVSDLAGIVNLSISQFERRFKKIFQVSPLKHITTIRLKAAAQLLISTDKTIAAIAQEAGFYDHSHFTRQFTKAMGKTPKTYRQINS